MVISLISRHSRSFLSPTYKSWEECFIKYLLYVVCLIQFIYGNDAPCCARSLRVFCCIFWAFVDVIIMIVKWESDKFNLDIITRFCLFYFFWIFLLCEYIYVVRSSCSKCSYTFGEAAKGAHRFASALKSLIWQVFIILSPCHQTIHKMLINFTVEHLSSAAIWRLQDVCIDLNHLRAWETCSWSLFKRSFDIYFS